MPVVFVCDAAIRLVTEKTLVVSTPELARQRHYAVHEVGFDDGLEDFSGEHADSFRFLSTSRLKYMSS